MIDNLRISIGMCAWNEEQRIGPTLRSLCKQDVIREQCDGINAVEIVILVNASTDRTAAVARDTLQEELGALGDPEHVQVKVVETPEGGLARSINKITHELSDPDADYLIKMDCDIEIVEPDVIRKLVARLVDDPKAAIASPSCVKHTAYKSRKTVVNRLSLLATHLQKDAMWYVPVVGAMYCGRASVLRSIWEPIGARGTDGYVRDMVVTENWRYPRERRDFRIVLADNATVVFDAYEGIGRIVYHRTRAVIGEVSRMILHEFFHEQVGDEDAGQLVLRLNQEDPDWYQELIQSRLGHGRWWVLPCPMFRWNRLRALKRCWTVRKIPMVPVAVLLELVDAIAVWRANHAFKTRAERTIWRPKCTVESE